MIKIFKPCPDSSSIEAGVLVRKPLIFDLPEGYSMIDRLCFPWNISRKMDTRDYVGVKLPGIYTKSSPSRISNKSKKKIDEAISTLVHNLPPKKFMEMYRLRNNPFLGAIDESMSDLFVEVALLFKPEVLVHPVEELSLIEIDDSWIIPDGLCLDEYYPMAFKLIGVFSISPDSWEFTDRSRSKIDRIISKLKL